MEIMDGLNNKCECSHHELLNYIINGKNDIAECLFQKLEQAGTPCEELKNSRMTMLHYSAQYGNKEMAEHLIQQGIDVNAQDNSGATPLMLAIQKSHESIVEVLLKNNADIFMTNSSGTNALLMACRKFVRYLTSTYGVLKQLIDQVNRDFLINNSKTMQLLLNMGKVVKHAIVAFANIELAEAVLQNGYLINYREPIHGYTALHYAVIYSKIQNVKLLIKYGANIKIENFGSRSVLFYYPDGCQDVDDNSDVLKKLLKEASKSNIYNRFSYCDINYLLEHGNKQTVRTVLLDNILSTEMSSSFSMSLLQLLFENENNGVLDLLIELNIQFDINESDYGLGLDFLCKDLLSPKKVNEDYLLSIICVENNPRPISNSLDLDAILNDVIGRNVSPVSKDKKIVIAHSAMLNIVDETSLSDQTRFDIESKPEFKAHFDICTEQLVKMKNIKIHGPVTVFKLLTESYEKILVYCRNQDLIVSFKNIISTITDIEPYYLNTLKRKMSKVIEIIALQKEVAPIFEVLTGISVNVYPVIVYNIIGYMCVKELKKLCEIQSILINEQ